MTISAISSGIAGMQRASNSFEASASRVARYGTGLADVDIASEMVGVMEAKALFKASTTIVRVADAMARSTIDILA